MIYKLKFLKIALKEWKKLDTSLRNQLKKKLAEILKHPQMAFVNPFFRNYRLNLLWNLKNYWN